MERTSQIIDVAVDAADMRRRMGAAALEMVGASDSSTQAQRRATVAARLPNQHWPQQPMFITAVDASTGEPIVFGHDSGVDLVDPSRRAVPVALPTVLELPIHRRRLPSRRECRSGKWIQPGADNSAARRQNTQAVRLGTSSRSVGRRTARARQQS